MKNILKRHQQMENPNIYAIYIAEKDILVYNTNENMNSNVIYFYSQKAKNF